MIDKISKSKKQAWPTKAAMVQVYDKQLWGAGETRFYSGEGSHLSELVNPYVSVVTEFLTSFSEPLTVCDLGCGDFNVGKQIVGYTKSYVAVDIVPDLIAHNKEQFKFDNLIFLCRDIALDDLPTGDCALVRQVLQHLSNAEVISVVNKLKSFKYVILTEHLPEGDFVPNKDIISGQGIRLKKRSGINLTAPPFKLKIKTEKQLLSIGLKDQKGIVVTTLFQMF